MSRSSDTKAVPDETVSVRVSHESQRLLRLMAFHDSVSIREVMDSAVANYAAAWQRRNKKIPLNLPARR